MGGDISADAISAAADVVMAIGIVFAAAQMFIAKRQQTAQLEIHVVELHTHFQKSMREIQALFPPEVNTPDWLPKDGIESRAVRLYWYLVFDEWYTCKHLSREKRLNDLWDRYGYGVMSALKKQAFRNEFEKMIDEEAIFFGLGGKFCAEIQKYRCRVLGQ